MVNFSSLFKSSHLYFLLLGSQTVSHMLTLASVRWLAACVCWLAPAYVRWLVCVCWLAPACVGLIPRAAQRTIHFKFLEIQTNLPSRPICSYFYLCIVTSWPPHSAVLLWHISKTAYLQNTKFTIRRVFLQSNHSLSGPSTLVLVLLYCILLIVDALRAVQSLYYKQVAQWH